MVAMWKNKSAYRLLFDTISDPIIIYSSDDGHILDVNKAMVEKSGFSYHELTKFNISDLWFDNSDEIKEKIKKIRELTLSEGPQTFEWQTKTKDGQIVDIEITTQAGEIDGIKTITAQVRNINLRKKTAEKLRKSEERLQFILSTANLGLYDYNVTTQKLIVSDSYARLLGYEPESFEETLQSWTDRIHPQDLERALGILNAYLDGISKDRVAQYRFRKKNGEYCWVISKGQIVEYDSFNHPIRMVGTVVNINDLKKTQEALQESQKEIAFLSEVVELSSLPFAIGYPGEKLALTNKAFTELTGYSEEELKGLKWVRALTPPEWKELTKQKLDELHATEKPVRYVKEYFHKDGSRKKVEILTYLKRDETGKPSLYYGYVKDITDQEKTQEALLSSQEQNIFLSELLETSIVPFVISYPDGRLMQTNTAFDKLRGYSKEELKSVRWNIDLTPPQWRETVSKIYEELDRTGQPISYNRELLCKDGAVKFVEIFTQVKKDEDGKSVLYYGFIKDITEQKKIKEALLESQKQTIFFSELLEKSSQPFASAYADGRLLQTNAAFSELTGYSEDELKTITWNMDLTPPEWREFLSQKIKELNETGKPIKYTRELICKDGSRKIVEILNHVKKDENGQPILYYGFITDITEQKAIENALVESEKKYRSVIEYMSDAVLLYDYETKRMIQSNSAAQIMLGYSAEEILELTSYDIVADTKENIDRNQQKTISSGEIFIAERPYRCKDGSIKIVDINSSVIDIEGRAVVSAVFKDITERRKIADELNAYRHQLEDLVNERTKELQQKNDELEAFTYTVSHDLKSPLTTIKGFIELLEDDIKCNNTNAIDKDLSRINSASMKMAQLVDDLLKFSRIDKSSFKIQEISLSSLIKDVKLSLESQIAMSGVKIDIFCDSEMLHSDKNLMVQVFQNLIENAIKYMGAQKEPKIEIGCDKVENELICYVKDNGIGIDQKYLNKVFDLFERIYNRYEGSGVGLAIVKRIIESQKGRVWVESEGTDKGSTFYFALPNVESVQFATPAINDITES